jgi:hypothetical protein
MPEFAGPDPALSHSDRALAGTRPYRGQILYKTLDTSPVM